MEDLAAAVTSTPMTWARDAKPTVAPAALGSGSTCHNDLTAQKEPSSNPMAAGADRIAAAGATSSVSRSTVPGTNAPWITQSSRCVMGR